MSDAPPPYDDGKGYPPAQQPPYPPAQGYAPVRPQVRLSFVYLHMKLDVFIAIKPRVCIALCTTWVLLIAIQN